MSSDIQQDINTFVLPSRENAASQRHEKTIMDDIQENDFQRRASVDIEVAPWTPRNSWRASSMQTVYGGIALATGPGGEIAVAMGIRDATYFLDYCCFRSYLVGRNGLMTDKIIRNLRSYEAEHDEKLLGIALPLFLAERCPDLCSRLWLELDAIPLVLQPDYGLQNSFWDPEKQESHRTIDELADSMSRRCISFFGPNKQPALQVAYMGDVAVDAGSQAALVNLESYRKSINDEGNWRALLKFAAGAREKDLKIAFFSATPQGGGVALMRHSLIRLLQLLGVKARWFVPRPSPGTFRITKTNHNILQGVERKGTRVEREEQEKATAWIQRNARRYWMGEKGPLNAPSDGGADFIVIDDPQMPGLIPLSKDMAPSRPVVYRSHIQIRSDLVADSHSPQREVWSYIWDNVRLADMYLSHPVKSFVPANIPNENVGYLPATTDFLDGLNKPMHESTVTYYGREFSSACQQMSMVSVNYPKDDYIVQIARFDPSKGIYDVLRSYNRFWDILLQRRPHITPPKLVICGHGSIDDPDAAMIYNATMEEINTKLRHLKSSVSVMRIQASDQVLNAILSKAKIALQLSTREGFEIKVTEALHHGIPIIVSQAGGIPLQVQHARNGFIVEIGDYMQTAEYIYDLYTDKRLYKRMSAYARHSVPDELSTIGNAMAWLYLANNMTQGEVRPNGAFINDMAREAAGEPYTDKSLIIPRDLEVSERNLGLPSGGEDVPPPTDDIPIPPGEDVSLTKEEREEEEENTPARGERSSQAEAEAKDKIEEIKAERRSEMEKEEQEKQEEAQAVKEAEQTQRKRREEAQRQVRQAA